uniref:Uncharacterized protein n=1 Tax=Oryza rufipogon TaxID=4529 RepID=A0A0E0NTB2_ORYRU
MAIFSRLDFGVQTTTNEITVLFHISTDQWRTVHIIEHTRLKSPNRAGAWPLRADVAAHAHDDPVDVPDVPDLLAPALLLRRAHRHGAAVHGPPVRRVDVRVVEADLHGPPLAGRVRQLHRARQRVRLPLVQRRERDRRRPALQLRPPYNSLHVTRIRKYFQAAS